MYENNLNIYPDSRPRRQKNTKIIKGTNWTPLYCANCGADGGFVPEENCNFAFYLCNPCAEKWQPLTETFLVPDEVFWETVKQEQLTKYGRELSGDEVIEVLKDDNSTLSLLCKDRSDFNKTIIH